MPRRIQPLFALCACAMLLAGCAGPERELRSPTGGKADGRILFAVNGNGTEDKSDGIYFLTNGGNARKVIAEGKGDYALQYPRWSPDGQQVAYVRVQDRGAYSDLWIARADGTAQRQMTSFRSKIPFNVNIGDQKNYVKDSSIVAGVSWANDTLSFACDKGGGGYLRPWFSESADARPGDSRVHAVAATANLPGDVQVDSTALSPDGQYMAFTVTAPFDARDKKTQVYVLNIGKKTWYQLTELPEGAYDPVWSPNSQYIAFTGRPAFRVNDIYVIAKDGKNPQKITETGAARAPVFSPNGDKIAFLSGAEGQFAIWTMDFRLPASENSPFTYGKPEKVFDGIKYIDARSGLSWAQ